MPEAFLDPVQHLVAARGSNVDVYIRHAGTARVQEALEQQVVRERVGQGDAQQVAQHGTGGTAPSCREDAVFPAVVGHFRCSEEKPGHVECPDSCEFRSEPLIGCPEGFLWVLHRQRLETAFLQRFLRSLSRAQSRFRGRQMLGEQVEAAFAGQFLRVQQRVREREQASPVLRRSRVPGIVPGPLDVWGLDVDAQPGAGEGVQQGVLLRRAHAHFGCRDARQFQVAGQAAQVLQSPPFVGRFPVVKLHVQ